MTWLATAPVASPAATPRPPCRARRRPVATRFARRVLVDPRPFAVLALALCLPLAAVAGKTLRVVGDNNYPPYLFIGPDGKPQGYVVDEWKLWEGKTGVKVELTATNWADAQQRIRSGQADVID